MSGIENHIRDVTTLWHGSDSYIEMWEACMRAGDFESAWQLSDRIGPLKFDMSALASRRLQVLCERGIGDAIHFLRYLRLLKDHCRQISLVPPPRLQPLLPFFAGLSEGTSIETGGRTVDFSIECSELPYLFRTTSLSIPASVPYIRAIPPPSSTVQAAIASVGPRQLKVGIAWAAGSWNANRSIPLSEFSILRTLKNVSLFSLQRGPALEDLQSSSGAGIQNLESDTGSIVDTAAAILQLDLVLSVDTMVAHLAGALGKPVWTLLQHVADWRWMEGRADCPWYPTMRLIRQPSPGDWAGLMRRVAQELPSEKS
jgi:hypothetical protein